MDSLTSSINVKVDTKVSDLPYEIVTPSNELLEALKEIEDMKKNPDKYQSYDNWEDLKKSLTIE